MSDSRDKAWYLIPDKGGQVAELEVRTDVLDWEISYERQRRHEETRDRLARLGYDVSDYKPLPPIHRNEQRCLEHFDPRDRRPSTRRSSPSAKEPAIDKGANREHPSPPPRTRAGPPEGSSGRDHGNPVTAKRIPRHPQTPTAVHRSATHRSPTTRPKKDQRRARTRERTAVEGQCPACGATPESSPPTRSWRCDRRRLPTTSPTAP